MQEKLGVVNSSRDWGSESCRSSSDRARFSPKNGTILLPIESSFLAFASSSSLEIDGKRFEKKQEFHITLVGFKQGKEITKAIKANPEIEHQINEVIATCNLIAIPKSEVFQISKDKLASDNSGKTVQADSVIQMIEVKNSADFYAELSNILGKPVDCPPLHVTLFTHGDKSGIGINSESELAACRPTRVAI